MNTVIEKQVQIEAILFASGEPVSIEILCEACEIQKNDFFKLLLSLQERYENTGLTVLLLGDTCQMVTRVEYGEVVLRAMDKTSKAPLSPAALEVLSTIAYNEPVTRNFIEQVRGVDSAGVLSGLLKKGLVAEAGRLDLPGRPIAYQTTAVFLRSFSLRSLEELPPLSEGEDFFSVEPDLVKEENF